MMQMFFEVEHILSGLIYFFKNLFSVMTNVFFAIISGLLYLVGYPAQMAILVAVLVLFVSDIITKFYSISIQCGGFYNAFQSGKLSSHALRDGLTTKAIGYFVILTISNFCIITPQIELIGKILSPILYTGLFLTETYSNLENLRDAGLSAVTPFMKRIKKEQDILMDSEAIDQNLNISQTNSEEGDI
jgi:hypothetical protein